MGDNPSHLPTVQPSNLPRDSKDDLSDRPAKGRQQSYLQYLKTEISLEHADIPIVATCLVSGLCDSSAYNAWTCFVSMQTGMTLVNKHKSVFEN
jgi:hypothetical protein